MKRCGPTRSIQKRTSQSGQVAPPAQTPQITDYVNLPAPVALERGDEMGRFKLGSTVILLFPPGVMAWTEAMSAGSVTRMGQEMGHFAGDRSGSSTQE